MQSSSVSLLLRCNDHLSKGIQALKADLSSVMDNGPLLDEIHQQKSGNIPLEAAAPEGGLPSAIPDASQFEPETEIVAEQAQEAATVIAEVSTQVEPPHPIEASPASLAPAVAPTAPKPTAAAPVKAASGAGNSQADESIRVSLGRLDKLINFVGEIVILQTVLQEQAQANNMALVSKTALQLGKVTKEVQDISMGLRMIPLKQTFQKMQRIVRDTSNALGKKVQLDLQGEDTEVDKTVLESLADPLVHLIRNAVDHGIEATEDRVKNGKTETGRIVLAAYQQSGSLIIEIRDDGGGINADRLRAKAVEKGILKPGATLSDADAYQLIFHSGFSTKTQVTDVSGRGVGMDVVKTNIEQLQGVIQLETEFGKGTCFRIRLPLTLAIIDGMVIKSEDQRFVIPLTHVHECARPGLEDVHFATGLGEIYLLRGENMPLYRLENLLGKKAKQQRAASESTAIVVKANHGSFAVLVDEIIGQYQVVIKQLGFEHQGLKGYSGSAILGDGKPALILELNDFVNRRKSA